ncbi:type IV secretion protein Rhs [Actinokineospora sp. HBU206404]|uniref:Type IV secretion protein Rhs n=1 Tax=Actinokineospora xionganensis TaxID=2684470 RepID=A0ABR7L5A0_9PSEU|nr:type IV secretion protein Rhs [Actinokineospora xionganensis]
MIAGQLMASLLTVVAAPPASAAGGPSTGLDTVPSTPVQKQERVAPGADQAAANQLSGDQPARTDKEGAGTAEATSLSPSATWAVSAHTGDFTWSYPMRVPPAAGGLEPDLGLSYRSSAVDGRTSVTNNQPTWVGDGWDLSAGFVERTYGGCAADTEGGTTPPKTGDLCWRSDNAVASYAGGGGMLIRDDAGGQWRARGDDGSRIERFTGAGNGDDDGEHWRVTTVDGTQYWFGSQPDARSTWTVPVFGDDANEPCHGATFDASHCVQAYRWNLDKVVDRNGNVMRYFYETETNSYGMNLKDAAVPYVRGGSLARIDYGMRADLTTPSGRVVFSPADRCVPGSACTSDKPDNWPDVPWDRKCDTATCAGKHSPSFWTTKRLASVTTQVLRGTVYTDVDRWELDHQFPDPGDGEKAALWLKGVKHTGLVGGSAEMPSVTFQGKALHNRVVTAGDGVAELIRYRVNGIVSETGGVISVEYRSQCAAGGPMPAGPETNTLNCFPVRWAKKNFAERTDWFHKYVVARVSQSDRLRVQGSTTSTFVDQVVSYEYLDGAAWHWDSSEFTKEDKKTWNEFRGFGRVRIRSGAPDDPAGPVTMTEQRFYRGMDGDKLPSGTRQATVTDSEGGVRTDADWLSGFGFESASFEREAPSDQPDPARISKSITDPAVHGPTATRGSLRAYQVNVGAQRDFTALSSGGWRTTKTETVYDDRGQPIRVNDLGDLSTADDDRCTRTEYARDTDKWLLNLAGQISTVSVACGATPAYPADALADKRHTFDAEGNLTKTEVAKHHPAEGPEYVVTATAAYDVHGRTVSATDALGRTTTTAFVPVTGGPVTQTVSTTPPTAAVETGLVTTTTVEPAWGLPTQISDPNKRRTDVSYDPLGRKSRIWLPNRSKTSYPNSPSARHEYLVRADAPTVVTTTKIGPRGSAITSAVVYDGLLRERQAQAPAMGGGRLLTDTRYDTQGRAWKSTQPYFQDAAVDTDLWVAADTDVPGHTRTLHDGAGRAVASVYYAGAHEKWRTTTAYGGDRVHVTPPSGGIATTTITDAQGRTTELRQHHGPAAGGGFDATLYTYTKAGLLETVRDPSGALWRNGYDFLGRLTKREDPDTGTSLMTYDELGRLSTVRDARDGTVAYAYDALGRKTGKFVGEVGGTKLAEWTYDTVTRGKGKPAVSTAWVDGKAYSSAVLSYDPLYQATGTSVTIPAEEGLLAGTYNSYAGYNPDGSLSSRSYAAAGELPEETVNYVHHDLGPVKSSSGGFNGVTTEHVTDTEYTRYGEVARLQLGSGAKRAWLSHYYDSGTRRLTRTVVDAELPSPMQSDVRYTYTPAGTITSIADLRPSAVDVQCFGMDQLGRITDAWTPGAATWSAGQGCQEAPSVDGLAGPAPYWHSYTYDNAGNRKTETVHAAAGNTVRTYTGGVADHAHALGSVTATGPGATGPVNYAYDASGNLASRTSGGVTRKLDWDATGKLAKVTEGGKMTSFVYDAAGSRLIRRDPGGTTLYLDGQEIRVAGAGGNPTATRYYKHGGKTVAMRQGTGQLTWLAGDHQGTSQIAVESQSQEVVQRRQLPFGGARGTAGAFPGERGFVGGTTDASTGFTHLGAREYDPETGRFISVDPVLDLTDAQQLNGYTYSNNSPVTRSDPSGLLSCPDGDCTKGKSGSRAPAKSAPAPPPPPPSFGGMVGSSRTTKYNPKLYGNLGLSRSDLQVWRSELSNRSIHAKSCDGNRIFAPQCMQAKGQLDAGNKEITRLAGLPPKKGPSPSFLEMSRAITRVQIEQEERFLRNTHLPGRDHGGITISACTGADLFVGMGAAAEVCVARDHKGWGWSASAKKGGGQVAGYGVGFSLKISEGTIKDLGGTGTWYSTEAGRATFEVARSSEGLLSVSAGPSWGADLAVLGGLEATFGEEWAVSGYFADMKLPDGMFEPVVGPQGQYLGPSLSAR